MDKLDVTIESAVLSTSKVSGMPMVALVFLPQELYFFNSIPVSRFYSQFNNMHPAIGWKRTELRSVLGMVIDDSPFIDKELMSVVGRLLRIVVDEVEFRDRMHLRVISFLPYSGKAKNLHYSDNEYVFMIKEFLREGN